MIKLLYKTFAAGLITSGLLSWIHIFHSNTTLAAGIRLLKSAGHLVVPNGHALDSLSSIMTALCGSLFFVMTAGILVTGASILSWLLVCKITARKKVTASFYLTLWAIITLLLNFSHFSWLTASHTMIIPIVIHGFLRQMSGKSLSLNNQGRGFISFFIAIAVTISCFYAWADRGIFLRTRDYLLLSNTPGQIINQWYYRYSPYASEALKSPLNRQVKPFWIDPKIVNSTQIKDILSTYGWLAASDRHGASLILEKSNAEVLSFNHGSRAVLSVDVNIFLKSPYQYLKDYSTILDNMVMFRFLCLGGIIIGFPLLIFGIVFLLLNFACSRFLPPKAANFMAGFLTAMISLLILLYLNPMEIKPDRTSIQEALSVKSPKNRIEALRVIVKIRSNIFDHRENFRDLMQGTPPERYWLANALGLSRNRQSIDFLEQLAFDGSINVQCAAIRAISRKGRNNGSSSILRKKIENSPHWYVQQKAYGALK